MHVVYSQNAQSFVPIEQVTDGLTFEAQNTLLMRRDRLLTITVGADVVKGMTAAQVQTEVTDAIESMELPPGYKMEWGGELESSSQAQESLGRQLPMSLIIMVVISVLLFNALRQPLIIWLLVPMSVSRSTLRFWAPGSRSRSHRTFGAAVAVGDVDQERHRVGRRDRPRARGKEAGSIVEESIVEASTSRLRPVVLAAATAILGMTPLIWDAFFRSMAVTIMGGLAFASILTLVAAPVFYYAFFMRSAKKAEAAMA